MISKKISFELVKKLDFDTDLNRIPLISDTEPLITTEATKTGLLADGLGPEPQVVLVQPVNVPGEQSQALGRPYHFCV